MKVTCFGSRGSLPSPSCDILGFNTSKFGGDTTCYMLEAGPFNIILDAGSGSRLLGKYLLKNNKFGSFIMLLTHYHWDHIQGMPFCVPFYLQNNYFNIHGFSPDNSKSTSYIANVLMDALSRQQDKPFFPVPHGSMPAKKNYVVHDQLFSETFFYTLGKGSDKQIQYIPLIKGIAPEQDEYTIKFTTIPLHHPNGCLGYRVEYMGKNVCFCWDNEPLIYPNKKMIDLCKNTDLIIMDGQYNKEQLSGMTQTFGHGQPEICVKEAMYAGAKDIIITHHDPDHDDVTLNKMEKDCQNYLIDLQLDYNKIVSENANAITNTMVPPRSVVFAKCGQTWEL